MAKLSVFNFASLNGYYKGLKQKLDLELISVKTFESGTVLLSYRPTER